MYLGHIATGTLADYYIIEFQRIIRCGGPVEDDMANIIVAQLLYLDAVDPNKVSVLVCMDI